MIMEVIKQLFYLFVSLMLFLYSGAICIIYFNGETKVLKVEKVYPLLPRDVTAKVLVKDSETYKKVYFCPTKIQVQDEIEVFSLSIRNRMISTNIPWWCILWYLILIIGCPYLIWQVLTDLVKEIKQKDEDL